MEVSEAGTERQEARGARRFCHAMVFCLLASILCFLSSVPQALANVEDGLVGYWKLDEIKTFWTDGKIGGALEFDGEDDGVTIATPTGNFGTGDFSVCFWMSITTDKSYFAIMQKGSSPGFSIWKRTYDVLALNLSNTDFNSSVLAIWGSDGWHHICVTADRDDVAWFYIDGAADISRDITAVQTSLDSAPMLVFAPGGVPAYTFAGRLDDMRFYNRVLTPAEVADIYNNNAPTSTGLTDHWKFDESSGTTAANDGTGNDGTLTNFEQVVLDSAGTNHGVPQGPVTLMSPSGVHGNGIDFGSDTDYSDRIDVPDNDAIEFGPGEDFSACVWAVDNSTVSEFQIYIQDRAGGVPGWEFWKTYSGSNQLGLVFNSSDIYLSPSGTNVDADGLWHHFCFSADRDGDVAFYMDGASLGATDISANSGDDLNNTNDLVIPFKLMGKMDDVRLYNRVLSAEEISELYTARCVDPVSVAGGVFYDEDNKVPRFCNNRDWVPFVNVSPTAGPGGPCTGPDGEEGAIFYNAGAQVLQYCAGVWIPIGAGTGGLVTGGLGSGYFAITSEAYPGDLVTEATNRALGPSDGYDAANKLCLNDLTNNDWMGKADAQARGLLTTTNVKAFLTYAGNHALPDTTYFFAVSGDDTKGGASFTTDGNGYGPNDSANWSNATRFAGNKIYFMGRASNGSTSWNNSTPSGSGLTNTCDGYRSASSSLGDYNAYGNANTTDGNRWRDNAISNCSVPNYLVCIVHP